MLSSLNKEIWNFQSFIYKTKVWAWNSSCYVVFINCFTKNAKKITFLPNIKRTTTYVVYIMQKQPSRSVLRKRSSGNMHQIYRRIAVPKCEFNKVALLSCKFAVYYQNKFSKKPLDNCFWLKLSKQGFGQLLLIVKTGIWSKSVIKKLQFD